MIDNVSDLVAQAARTPLTPEGLAGFYEWLLAFPDEFFFHGVFRRPRAVYPVLPREGRLITFDGISGCGKNTQIALLEKRLQGAEEHAFRSFFTKRLNPFREVLIEYWKEHPVDRNRTIETALLWAGRRYCNEVFLKPALAEPGIVLQCRSFLSDVVFMSETAGGVLEFLTLCGDDPKPDLGLIMTVPVATAAARIGRRAQQLNRNIQPQEEWGVLNRTAEHYEAVLANPPGRFLRIDADCSQETVHAEIWQALYESCLLAGC